VKLNHPREGGFGSETKPSKRKVKIKLVINGLKKKKAYKLEKVG